jgi:hypothetical protein
MLPFDVGRAMAIGGFATSFLLLAAIVLGTR